MEPNFIEVVVGMEEIFGKFPQNLLQKPEFLELLGSLRAYLQLPSGIYFLNLSKDNQMAYRVKLVKE